MKVRLRSPIVVAKANWLERRFEAVEVRSSIWKIDKEKAPDRESFKLAFFLDLLALCE